MKDTIMDYKFVEFLKKSGIKWHGNTFIECQNIIMEEAQNGWRLKQVVVPFNEQTGVYGAWCYQIIFEREA